ncbi:hypothetical protein FOPE_09423 [Fonsecaea pedrosoi]|nr:hypothetical protein FOPE_09423 [Fonsecaea pedrosoi]
MGIPRLSQDLSPYADRVILGAPPQTSTPADATIIKDLIIDGPSLVYWVYNKLVAHQRLNSITSATLPPTYGEINRTLHHLLHDFQARGVNIQHIFFDGGLPVSKRPVRLERMEKLRQQLQVYRNFHPEFPPAATLPSLRDFDKILWDTPVLSTRKITLPTPPFMVASAIESLSTTEWKDCVHVVPGEADAFCALAAQQSTSVVAILTNDFDLVIHDLGPNGRVVLLHSIETKHRVPQKSSYISALSFDPELMTARFKISSLLSFGFERFLDSGASFSIIQERARDSSRLERLRNEYMMFAEPFVQTPPSVASFSYLENLDPRTAEIVSDLGDPLHIYLIPLLEDPQRDSSWSYGAKIRQIAYSLLLKTSPDIVGGSLHMVEFARKGQRITSASVTCLQLSEVIEKMAELLQLLEALGSFSGQTPTVSNESRLLEWYMPAVCLVQQEKSRLGKTPPSSEHVLKLLGLGLTTKLSASTRITWDDVHLLANIQAVLYSIRILAQITEYIVKSHRLSDSISTHGLVHHEDISKLINNLHPKLSTLPPVETLFLDIPHLRAQLSNADLKTQGWAFTSLRRLLDTDSGVNQADHDTSVTAAEERDSASGDWIDTTAKKEKERKRKRQDNFDTGTTRSTNGFDLLSEEPG